MTKPKSRQTKFVRSNFCFADQSFMQQTMPHEGLFIYLFIYSIMHFKHRINGKVNKMNSKHIIWEMAKPVGLKHAV